MLTQSHQSESTAYLTVSQAAARLSVHPSTIRRWIDGGRLPAYRLGERRIGVKPSDLTQLVSRRFPRSAKVGQAPSGSPPSARTLTSAERQRGLRALTQLERLDQELLQRRGGKPFAPSWELLDQARLERTRDLMRES